MSTYSDKAIDLYSENIKKLFKQNLDAELCSIEQLKGGANSIVFKAVTTQGREYFVKQYVSNPADKRDRLKTEFSGLSFLWKNELRAIPEPVFMDSQSKTGVYGFINGSIVQSSQITMADVMQAARFVSDLFVLSQSQGANEQPFASEACLSLSDYGHAVKTRLKKLKSVLVDEEMVSDLHAFLDDEFLPLFEEALELSRHWASQGGLDFNKPINDNERILSPSDIGFHNIIKGSDDNLFFIDLEYFGLDDPAKLISDFFQQTGVPMPVEYRRQFYESSCENSNLAGLIEKRLPGAYLLTGLKWCLLMLNIFTHKTMIIRYNKKEQLTKARNKLALIRRELDALEFPMSLSESNK